MMERLSKNRVLTMLLVSTFLISLLVLLSRLTPSQPLAGLSSSGETDTTTTAEELVEAENLVQVKTEPLKNWKPKPWGKLDDTVERVVIANLKKDGPRSKDRMLLTAVANNGMADYTLNWIASLKKCGLDKEFVVFAIDSAMVDTLTKAGYGQHVVLIPDHWFHEQLSSDFEAWLSNGYTPITHAKTLVVERLLYAGITVWFSDVDIVFTSPAIYDYLHMKLNARKYTETVFTQETEQDIINSGFYIMRPTRNNKYLLAASIDIQDKEPEVTQQRAMNRVLKDFNLNYQTSPIVLLDLLLFPHGRMYFDRHIPTTYHMTPMMVHANYRKGDNKKKDLIKFNLWYID